MKRYHIGNRTPYDVNCESPQFLIDYNGTDSLSQAIANLAGCVEEDAYIVDIKMKMICNNLEALVDDEELLWFEDKHATHCIDSIWINGWKEDENDDES